MTVEAVTNTFLVIYNKCFEMKQVEMRNVINPRWRPPLEIFAASGRNHSGYPDYGLIMVVEGQLGLRLGSE